MNMEDDNDIVIATIIVGKISYLVNDVEVIPGCLIFYDTYGNSYVIVKRVENGKEVFEWKRRKN